MKMIGAGFGRTGTMSLKAALEQIGMGPCFHMIDLVRDPAPLPYWQAAAAGEEVDWRRRSTAGAPRSTGRAAASGSRCSRPGLTCPCC